MRVYSLTDDRPRIYRLSVLAQKERQANYRRNKSDRETRGRLTLLGGGAGAYEGTQTGRLPALLQQLDHGGDEVVQRDSVILLDTAV